MKPFDLSFCSHFSTVTLNKKKIFLHILDDEPMKTFGSGQSSIMNEHNTKDSAGLRPNSKSINYGRSIEIPKLENFLNHKTKITVEFP